MKIVFDTVKINNFLSFDKAEIDLKDRNIVAVRGINNNDKDAAKSNGSGKSTIFNAICWALTGETINGVKDICNIYADDGAYVELTFTVDNDNYRIIRSKNHSAYKTNLKVYVNGEDKSGKGIKDSEKLLADYLPDITSEYIGSVIILGQGLPHKFTDNTPAGRKELLEKLFKSDFMIEDLKKRIDERKKELDVKSKSISTAIITSNARIDACKVKNLKAEKSLEELKNCDVDSLNANLKIWQHQLEEYTNQKTTDNYLLNEYVAKQTEINNTITAINTKLTNDTHDLLTTYSDKIA